MEWDWTLSKKCPVCGKNFFITSTNDWAYRHGRDKHRKYLCSWTCLRKYQKAEEEKELYRREHTFIRRKKNATGCDGNRNV